MVIDGRDDTAVIFGKKINSIPAFGSVFKHNYEEKNYWQSKSIQRRDLRSLKYQHQHFAIRSTEFLASAFNTEVEFLTHCKMIIRCRNKN